MGILERIASARGEQRYSADTYLSDYVMPFNYGGVQYGVPGANGLVQTLAGNRASEIVRTLPGYAAALRQCPPAFAAQNVRATVLSQARFAFRNRSTKKVFSNTKLAPLETPWTNASTGELIARMEWSAGLAGNAYVLRQPKRLRVLRPDWVAVVYGSQQEPEDAAQALDGVLLGYVYQNGGLWSDAHNPTPLLPEDVAHWSPIPDPEHAGVGQSWITPAVRDMQQDRVAGEHTIRFFENGATPNLVVTGIPAATAEQFNALVGMMDEKHSGLANAYKTLYLTAGADATIVGANLDKLDLKSVHGSAETRIASLSRVHPVILGIAEGLAGSSLNAGNFGMARRIWADTWIYPTLQDLAASLATIIDVPRDAELWFDTRDIPLLREDGKDAAEIEQTKASTIVSLSTGGFTRKSAVLAVASQDVTLLEEDPNWVSVQLQQSAGSPAPAPNPKPAAEPPARERRHLPGKHNQLSHGDGTGAAAKAVAKAGPPAGGTATIRGPRGDSMTVATSRGRISVRIPRHYENEDGPDTVDVPVDADLVQEFADLDETVRQYQARVRQTIKKMDAAAPGSDAYVQAQNEFFQLSGDGQRVAAGGRVGDGGELNWDVIFEEEDQPTYRLAIRPPDADDDWDMAYAVDTPDGGIELTAAGFRKFAAQVEAAAAGS